MSQPAPSNLNNATSEEPIHPVEAAMAHRILLLDGAYGTAFQGYNLDEESYRNEALAEHATPLAGNHDLLCLTRPEIVEEVHLKYLEAGADILKTNTFSGTSIAQADFSTEHLAYEINRAGAEVAKAAAAKMSTNEWPRFVAGSVGPTNRTASLSPDVNRPGFRNIGFDELVTSYSEAIRGLADGGIDLLLIETIFDTLNAKAAIYAALAHNDTAETRLPILVSGTITDASGRTLSGQTPEAFLYSVEHANPLAIGLNCSEGST